MLVQDWSFINGKESVCEFIYQAKGWSKSRILRDIRILTGYKEVRYLGDTTLESQYEYFVIAPFSKTKIVRHCKHIQETWGCENWTGQTNNQLSDSQTLTGYSSKNEILLFGC